MVKKRTKGKAKSKKTARKAPVKAVAKKKAKQIKKKAARRVQKKAVAKKTAPKAKNRATVKAKAKALPAKKRPANRPVKKASPTPKRSPAGKKARIAAPRQMAPGARKKSAVHVSEIATATLGFEDIISQVSEGQAEEAKLTGSKFDIGVAHNAHAMPVQDIPQGYDKTQVMVLVVDPRFVFTYWEVRHDTMMEAQHRFNHQGKLTLRFYDITHESNTEVAPSWDVEVFDRLGNWYLRLERPEQRICLDVGVKGPSGEFWRVARSNIMRLPPQSLAAPGPIKWMVVTPAGETLISDSEDYTEADLSLLKKILGPYFFDLLMRGRFASIAGSSVEAIFYDVEALRTLPAPGESPSSPLAWARR